MSDKQIDKCLTRDGNIVEFSRESLGDSKLRWGPNIKINENLRGNIAAVSAILVHEGVHNVIGEWGMNKLYWKMDRLDEELKARMIAISYFRDLLEGISIYSFVAKKN